MKLIEMEKVLSELCLSHKDIIYIDKNETAERIRKIPSIDIVRCAECKHRPIKVFADGADWGFNVIAPNEDERCPCLVEDGWYSWRPDDNFYCSYGERREP